MLGALGVSFSLLPCFLGNSSFTRQWQLYPGTPRFRESDSDRLSGGARAVLALANMFNLFANKFARLGRRRLTLCLILAGTFDSLFLWHNN